MQYVKLQESLALSPRDVGVGLRIQNKSSAVAEMGDRGHNRHGLKRGGLLYPFRGELEPV